MARNYQRQQQSVTPYQSGRSLLDFNVYQPEFIGRPIEEISKMVDTRSTDNANMFNQLSALDVTMSNLDVNPNDEGAKQAMLEQRQKFNEGIDLITQPDNYNLAGTYVNKLGTDFAKNKWLQTSVENNAKYQAALQELKSKRDKNLISEAAYQMGIQQAKPNTQQEAEGLYSSFEPMNIVNYYDTNDDLSNFKFDKKTIRHLMEPVRDEQGNITSYNQREITSIDEKELRQSMMNLIGSNPEAMASIKQEFQAEGGNPNDNVALDAYINNIIDPYVRSKVGSQFGNGVTDIKNYQTRVSTDSGNRGSGNEDSPYSGKIYMGSKFLKANKNEVDNITNGLEAFKKSSWLTPRTGFENYAPQAKGAHSSVETLANIDEIDLPNMSESEQAAFEALDKTTSTMFDKSFKDATLEERNKAYDKVMKTTAIQSEAYESAFGRQFTNKVADDKTVELFNSKDFTRSKDGEFKFTGGFTQGVWFNPYTDEYYDDPRQFANDINSGKVKVRDKDGDKTLADGSTKIEMRVMSDINNSNSLPWKTGDFAFTNGYIISIDGYDFIYGDKQTFNTEDVIANIYNKVDKDNLASIQAGLTDYNNEVSIKQQLPLLGLQLPSEIYNNPDISDVRFNVNENGLPEISVYRGTGGNMYEDVNLSDQVAKSFNQFFNKKQ